MRSQRGNDLHKSLMGKIKQIGIALNIKALVEHSSAVYDRLKDKGKVKQCCLGTCENLLLRIS